MRRSALLAAVVLTSAAAAGVVACASLLGIQDGTLDQGDDDGSVNICSADSGVQADGSQLFVAAEIGDDTAGCTEQTPCKTIGAAIATAEGHPEFHIIYVASINPKNNNGIGVYPESVTLPPGMEIQGGWYARGRNPSVQWQQVCDATVENQTANIVGLDSVAIHAENLNGSGTLTKVVIKTKAPAPGESVYGIFAGPMAKITLNQVRIDIGNGGDGNPGTTGTDGNPGSGTCKNSGTGTAGADGDAGTPAPQTVFNATGAVSANGTSGGDGPFGSNGAVGPDGGCVTCVTCAVGNCNKAADTLCGTGGLAGCAGAGGSGGGPGQSGGSSIGIFAWGSLVTVNGGIVHSGKGGNGGVGGAGGKGGPGSNGANGVESSTCNTSCLDLGIVSCGENGTGKGSAGGPGTTGGRGGNGGVGASGAGGDSVAIVSGLDASVLTDAGDPVDIAAGPPGAGPPAGLASPRYP